MEYIPHNKNYYSGKQNSSKASKSQFKKKQMWPEHVLKINVQNKYRFEGTEC